MVFLIAKLVPVGYGIKKLQISCVVEDDKVGTDFLEEKITAFEDHVSLLYIQSISCCRENILLSCYLDILLSFVFVGSKHGYCSFQQGVKMPSRQ